jgi:hypothetical protein
MRNKLFKFDVVSPWWNPESAVCLALRLDPSMSVLVHVACCASRFLLSSCAINLMNSETSSKNLCAVSCQRQGVSGTAAVWGW